jgi:4-hydroxy-2-oxoheptanedioate aldolase
MTQQRAQYTNDTSTGIHMRPSRVLRKIRAGGVASSLKLNTADARAVEIFAMSGIDAIWLCTEHVPGNYVDLEHQVRAAKLYDVDTIYRVPRGSYSDYIRGFEMDACGLMVPHIMNVADARAVVRMTKFPPLGRRAVDGGNADGGYCMVQFEEYLETANRERFICCQIEDPEAVPHIEAIAELPGVDMLFFGAGDYSVAIGKPGQLDHPEVQAVRIRIAKAARKAGKAAGAATGVTRIREFVDMGYNYLNTGSDVGALSAYALSVAKAFEGL